MFFSMSRLQDGNNKAYATSILIYRWLGIRLSVLCSLMVTVVVFGSAVLIGDPGTKFHFIYNTRKHKLCLLRFPYIFALLKIVGKLSRFLGFMRLTSVGRSVALVLGGES